MPMRNTNYDNQLEKAIAGLSKDLSSVRYPSCSIQH